jgi:hypothetical protein
VNRRPFFVVVDSEGSVLVYGYELHQELGDVHEVAEGQWQATVAGRDRPLQPPVRRREVAVECLVRHWGFRGDYEVRLG